MDTNIKNADLTHAGIGLSPPISLPGEQAGGFPPAAPETGACGTADLPPEIPVVSAAPKHWSRRGRLLASVGFLVGLGAVGAGAYVFRDKIAPGALPYIAKLRRLPTRPLREYMRPLAAPSITRRQPRLAGLPPPTSCRQPLPAIPRSHLSQPLPRRPPRRQPRRPRSRRSPLHRSSPSLASRSQSQPYRPPLPRPGRTSRIGRTALRSLR